MRLLLQQKIDAAREDVQAVDDIGGDFGVEPVRILKIALNHYAVGVGVHFLDDLKAFKPAQERLVKKLSGGKSASPMSV